MDDVLEFIFEFLFEFGSEIAKEKKVSKWIRYPLILLLITSFLGVVSILIFTGVLAFSTNIVLSICLFALGLFILIGGIYKFRKEKLTYIFL